MEVTTNALRAAAEMRKMQLLKRVLHEFESDQTEKDTSVSEVAEQLSEKLMSIVMGQIASASETDPRSDSKLMI